MTKREYANQLFQLIKNSIEENKLEVEIIDDIELFIDLLEPKDIEQFAKWGFPNVQVEPSKCWGNKNNLDIIVKAEQIYEAIGCGYGFNGSKEAAISIIESILSNTDRNDIQNVWKAGDSVRGSWKDNATGKTYYTEGVIVENPKTGLWVQEQPDGGITHLSDFFFIIKQ